MRNGHLYVGDQTFANPGGWDQTINIDSNVHARMLVEERNTGTQTVLWAHAGGNAAVGTISNHDFRILAAGEKIRVKTNGNVGIGTTSPDTKLDVQSGGTTQVKIQGSGNDYVNAAVVLQANDNDDYRGLGVYMQNMQGDRSWYMGNYTQRQTPS